MEIGCRKKYRQEWEGEWLARRLGGKMENRRKGKKRVTYTVEAGR